MKVFRALAAILGGLCLTVTLLASGFAAAASPPATHVFSGMFSKVDGAPYAHDQLVALADATRVFTVDPYGSGGEQGALDTLANSIVDEARKALEQQGTQDRWTNNARSVLAAATSSNVTEAMYALAEDNVSYAHSEDAISHLVDCNTLINGVRPVLVGAAILTLVCWIALAAMKARRALSRMLSWPSALLACAFVVLGIWAFADFRGFFSAFHAVFFPQGNWTFDVNSLLITLYPQEFWVALGALWLAVTLIVAIIFFALGVRSRKPKADRPRSAKHARA